MSAEDIQTKNSDYLARSFRAERRSRFANILSVLCRFPRFRSRCFRWIRRLEGGQMTSSTYRELLGRYYGVKVGTYSYGSLLDPGTLPRGSVVGSYCSFGPGIVAFRRNHTMSRVSQHPFFYNAACGVLKEDSIPGAEDNPLRIENDVWIGANAIILPRCRRIGNGTVIGAGAVVTTDVPDFAIVAGNPAKLIRKRFDDAICEVLLESRWWDHPLGDLLPVLPLFLEDASLQSAQRLRDHVLALQRKAVTPSPESERAITSDSEKP